MPVGTIRRPPELHPHPGDLADRDSVEAYFAQHKPNCVVNLAAQAGVRYSAQNPPVHASSNVTDLLHIQSGRRINNGMGGHMAAEVVRLMARNGINPVGARVLVLGLAFQENCPDLRNSRVIEIIDELSDFQAQVDVCDPWVDAAEAHHEQGITPISEPKLGECDAVVLGVGHAEFAKLEGQGVRELGRSTSVVYDVKYVLPRHAVDGSL